ncbi:MAG: histidinol dehydrogenase [Lysobacteraceae bacterium]|nr:MAG: histidinol dehydrogenase [Xanthomonadaceae bacterium]
MNELIRWTLLDNIEQEAVLARPNSSSRATLNERVGAIIEEIRQGGDDALCSWSRVLDGAEPQLPISKKDLQAQAAKTTQAFRGSAKLAAENIRAFQQACLPKDTRWQGPQGQRLDKRFLPLRRVGLYIPGGTAPLVSTLMMLAIPARIAGCEQVIMCTPPSPMGLAPEIAWAALEYGIDQVFTVGGAQAIAAMAFGTESIAPCDKLFGPGNAWVTAAKAQVSTAAGGPGIDMLAGPSEAMVVADATADPRWIAADLLAQAEHGSDAQVLLVATNADLIKATQSEVDSQLQDLPRRDIAELAMANARFILVDELSMAIEVANRYAPEHLLLQVNKPDALTNAIRAAGSVFVGRYAAESFGDYSSGSNHVLPTGGTARFQGTVDPSSFMKAVTFQSFDRASADRLGPATIALAEAEGLRAHAQAVACRLNSNGSEEAA